MSLIFCLFCFFKQKTAYEMRISDWSSDVCSSDLPACRHPALWQSWGCPPPRVPRHRSRRMFEAFATLRSEEHTSELQSLMLIPSALFCLKKKHTAKLPSTAQQP